MRKIIEKNSKEWNIFQRIYKFYQDHAIPEISDEYWDSVVKEMSAIENEYDKHPLAVWLSYGVGRALQDRLKE